MLGPPELSDILAHGVALPADHDLLRTADSGGFADADDDPYFLHVRRLGSGVAGQVRLARSRAHQNLFVAVKCIARGDGDDGGVGGSSADGDVLCGWRTFEREARAAAAVAPHRHVARCLGTYSLRRWHCVALALAVRGTLEDVVASAFPTASHIPEATLTQWLAQLLLGLEHLHGSGLLVRDIKPANVLADGSLNLLLADFGVSKLADAMSTASATTMTNGGGGDPAQQEHTVVGSIGFVAPEIMRMWGVERRAAYGPACDLYSLGAIFFALITRFGEEGGSSGWSDGVVRGVGDMARIVTVGLPPLAPVVDSSSDVAAAERRVVSALVVGAGTTTTALTTTTTTTFYGGGGGGANRTQAIAERSAALLARVRRYSPRLLALVDALVSLDPAERPRASAALRDSPVFAVRLPMPMPPTVGSISSRDLVHQVPSDAFGFVAISSVVLPHQAAATTYEPLRRAAGSAPLLLTVELDLSRISLPPEQAEFALLRWAAACAAAPLLTHSLLVVTPQPFVAFEAARMAATLFYALPRSAAHALPLRDALRLWAAVSGAKATRAAFLRKLRRLLLRDAVTAAAAALRLSAAIVSSGVRATTPEFALADGRCDDVRLLVERAKLVVGPVLPHESDDKPAVAFERGAAARINDPVYTRTASPTHTHSKDGRFTKSQTVTLTVSQSRPTRSARTVTESLPTPEETASGSQTVSRDARASVSESHTGTRPSGTQAESKSITHSDERSVSDSRATRTPSASRDATASLDTRSLSYQRSDSGTRTSSPSGPTLSLSAEVASVSTTPRRTPSVQTESASESATRGFLSATETASRTSTGDGESASASSSHTLSASPGAESGTRSESDAARSQSASTTNVVTASVSVSVSRDGDTVSLTPSRSPTREWTRSFTATLSAPTPSRSAGSFTAAVSESATLLPSDTLTVSKTFNSTTREVTGSGATRSASAPASASQTPSGSQAAQSATLTQSPSRTPSDQPTRATRSPSASPQRPSQSLSLSASRSRLTPSATDGHASVSPRQSPSRTMLPTPSATPTASPTGERPSASATPSRATPTLVATPSPTHSTVPTPSATLVATPSPLPTPSNVTSPSATPVATTSPTGPTPSRVPSPSATRRASQTVERNTPSASPSLSWGTVSEMVTATFTVSGTRSRGTVTPSGPSSTEDSTLTVTMTVTPPPTPTHTRTQSPVWPEVRSAWAQAWADLAAALSDPCVATSAASAIATLVFLFPLQLLHLLVRARVLKHKLAPEDTYYHVRLWRWALCRHNVYLGATLLPCHFRCAWLHALQLAIHIQVLLLLHTAITARIGTSVSGAGSGSEMSRVIGMLISVAVSNAFTRIVIERIVDFSRTEPIRPPPELIMAINGGGDDNEFDDDDDDDVHVLGEQEEEEELEIAAAATAATLAWQAEAAAAEAAKRRPLNVLEDDIPIADDDDDFGGGATAEQHAFGYVGDNDVSAGYSTASKKGRATTATASASTASPATTAVASGGGGRYHQPPPHRPTDAALPEGWWLTEDIPVIDSHDGDHEEPPPPPPAQQQHRAPRRQPTPDLHASAVAAAAREVERERVRAQQQRGGDADATLIVQIADAVPPEGLVVELRVRTWHAWMGFALFLLACAALAGAVIVAKRSCGVSDPGEFRDEQATGTVPPASPALDGMRAMLTGGSGNDVAMVLVVDFTLGQFLAVGLALVFRWLLAAAHVEAEPLVLHGFNGERRAERVIS